MAERSCVVCREKCPPDELVRLALAPDGQAIIDFRGKLPGRGGWAHPRCLSVLEQRPGVLKRALKVQVPTGAWVRQYRAALERAVCDGLSMAHAAGALVGGQVVLSAALKQGDVLEVALATDCAARTERAIRESAGVGVEFTRLSLSAADIGQLLGRGPRAAIGVRRSRSAIHLQRQLRRLRSLG